MAYAFQPQFFPPSMPLSPIFHISRLVLSNNIHWRKPLQHCTTRQSLLSILFWLFLMLTFSLCSIPIADASDLHYCIRDPDTGERQWAEHAYRNVMFNQEPLSPPYLLTRVLFPLSPTVWWNCRPHCLGRFIAHLLLPGLPPLPLTFSPVSLFVIHSKHFGRSSTFNFNTFTFINSYPDSVNDSGFGSASSWTLEAALWG
jgi:hypothetical protein